MPFIALDSPPSTGGSGLVAAGGLVVSRRRAVLSASNRRFSQQNWQTAALVWRRDFPDDGPAGLQSIVETADFSGIPDQLRQLFPRRHLARSHRVVIARRLHQLSLLAWRILPHPRKRLF